MQKNVNEAHAKASKTLQSLPQEIDGYMHSLDQESDRPQNISDKIWQMMQSNDMAKVSVGKRRKPRPVITTVRMNETSFRKACSEAMDETSKKKEGRWIEEHLLGLIRRGRVKALDGV